MIAIARSVREITGLSSAKIPAELLASTEPLVLKGLVGDWPMVQAARQSAEAADAYIRRYFRDATVGAFVGSPDIQGRFFYNDRMNGFNYRPVMAKLDAVLDRLRAHRDDPRPPAIYVGSTTLDACLPGFRADNDLGMGDRNPLVSIWLGNRTRVAAHFDVPDNVACVAAGRRRFTLFPPEQIGNLYIGPLDFTPAGQAISLVDFERPDFERYPRFRVALEHAQTATLEPGDAIFIPSMWWHHVEGLESFNVLINYWWRQSPAHMASPADVLNHALLSIRDLPPAQRKAWQAIFSHYVFDVDEQTASHIPEQRRGILSAIDEPMARKILAGLLNKLNR